ncbi:MAG: DUF1272 domain-containing protein [Myxococcales bacterium]
MLQLRPNCECCDRDLPPDSGDAFIALSASRPSARSRRAGRDNGRGTAHGC